MDILPVLESVSDAIFVADKAGTIVWCNAAVERIGFCADRNELLSRSISDIFQPQDRIRNAKQINEAVCASNRRTCEFLAAFGSDAAWEWSLVAHDFGSDTDSRFARIVVMQRVTPSREVSADGKRSMLEAIVHNQQHALDAVATELRTPLSGMRATVECLMFDLDPEEHPEFMCLQLIEEEINRTSAVINEFVEFSQLLTGTYPWNWREFDLKQILQTVEAEMHQEAIQHAKIVRYCMQMTNTIFVGDQLSVTRLIERLVQNAIRHSTGTDVWVTLRDASNDASSFVCEVEDQGPGIPIEIIKNVEQALCAKNKDSDPASHSMGAGLLACAATAAAHGGTLVISSPEGRGARVRALLRGDLKAALEIDADRKLKDTVRYETVVNSGQFAFPEF